MSARFLVPLVLAFALQGCATLPGGTELPGVARTAMVETPFFPQEMYQCGPAALASVLQWSGMSIEPGQLAEEVYLPVREGSLQLELIAATRRHGRVPYLLSPTLEAMFKEVQAGHPVLVLQNLGLSWSPRWHYAVLVGYDLDQQEVTLHSGSTRNEKLALRTFYHTWKRGGAWSLVALPPARLPITATPENYVRAVATLEELGSLHIAEQAYRSAGQRWPEFLPVHLGLANVLFTQQRLEAAEIVLRQATVDHPLSPEAHNNLAYVLLSRGDLAEAERIAQQAIELGGRHQPAAKETLEQIRRRLAALKETPEGH